MPLFKIYTLGCKVNSYDSGSLKEKLSAAGFAAANANAQVAIVNTCSVTKSAIRKNKQIINKAKKENPGAKIVLTGCWPKVYDVRAEDFGVDFVFKTGEEKELIGEIAKLKLSAKERSAKTKSRAEDMCRADAVQGGRSRYFIKIQDGCEQYCTYCVIPYARGRLRSRPEEEVIGEIRKAVDSGFREIVLSGIHIGLYGQDFEKAQNSKFSATSGASEAQGRNPNLKIDLVGLIKKIIKIKNLGRVRISSIEVTEVGDELTELIKGTDKICEHLHISLQSGCDKILKLMNRPYSAEYFADRIEKLRKAMPDIAVTTDVIVGFPGETDADFKKTYDFCEKMKFGKIHVFSFSAHEKAPASKMSGQISKEKIIERSKKLRSLSARLEKEYKNKFKGKEVRIVIEGRGANGTIKGKSEFYFDIELDEARFEKYGGVEYRDELIGKIFNLPVESE